MSWFEDWFQLIGDYGHTDADGYVCTVFRDLQVRNFIGVIGQETIFRVAVPVAKSDILDGLENTILILEVDNSQVRPGELIDWTYVNLEQHLGPTDVLEPILIETHHRSMLFADGLIFRQLKPIGLQTLRALLTTSGGETITRDQLISQGVLEHRSGEKW